MAQQQRWILIYLVILSLPRVTSSVSGTVLQEDPVYQVYNVKLCKRKFIIFAEIYRDHLGYIWKSLSANGNQAHFNVSRICDILMKHASFWFDALFKPIWYQNKTTRDAPSYFYRWSLVSNCWFCSGFYLLLYNHGRSWLSPLSNPCRNQRLHNKSSVTNQSRTINLKQEMVKTIFSNIGLYFVSYLYMILNVWCN